MGGREMTRLILVFFAILFASPAFATWDADGSGTDLWTIESMKQDQSSELAVPIGTTVGFWSRPVQIRSNVSATICYVTDVGIFGTAAGAVQVFYSAQTPKPTAGNFEWHEPLKWSDGTDVILDATTPCLPNTSPTGWYGFQISTQPAASGQLYIRTR